MLLPIACVRLLPESSVRTDLVCATPLPPPLSLCPWPAAPEGSRMANAESREEHLCGGDPQ